MLGAITGDIIGSVYEWNNIKTTSFPLFSPKCRPTDDSIMSLAVAHGFMNSWGQDDEKIKAAIVRSMQEFGMRYPNAGYGGRFFAWIFAENPMPYNSWGNGSGMRVSSAAWLFDNMEDVLHMAELSAEVTHNHEEGIKGAKALAAAIFMARKKFTGKDIKRYVEENFGYDLDTSLDTIRPSYHFDVSCQGSVPQAIRAFLEADSYEEAVRLAVSIGGDSDTIACMAGAVAEAYYGMPSPIKEEAFRYMDPYFRDKLEEYRKFYLNHKTQS